MQLSVSLLATAISFVLFTTPASAQPPTPLNPLGSSVVSRETPFDAPIDGWAIGEGEEGVDGQTTHPLHAATQDPLYLNPTPTDEGEHEGESTLLNPPQDEGDQHLNVDSTTETETPFVAPPPAAFDPSVRTSWGRDVIALAPSQYIREVLKQTDLDLSQTIEMARSQGKPYVIWVNIPSYTLRVFDTATGQQLLSSRVIVGASGTQTPIFSTDVVNIKFNPDWSPPPSLQRKGKRYTPPGPNNPLGQARFSTNNNMNIYLHDTNNHSLFNQARRALSAGCVRVEQWHALSQILTGLGPEGVDGYTEGNRITYVDVPDSLVWISYQRVDLNDANILVVHPDVYRMQEVYEEIVVSAPSPAL